ncbi:MAG: Smr/MutS family protein [Bacilli bacterium]
MNKHFEDLQINIILDRINMYILTKQGKDILFESEYFNSYKSFKIEKDILNDALACCFKYGKFSLNHSQNIESKMIFATKGGILDREDFDTILSDISSVKMLHTYDKKFASQYQNFHCLFLDFTLLDNLEIEIRRVYDENFDIKDDASSNLHDIRRKLKAFERNLKSTIEKEMSRNADLLTDSVYTLRDGAFVLPVKTSFKGRVNGLLHDISDSGETTFIEPQSCLIISNEIHRLKSEEKEEIYKIVKALSLSVSTHATEIIRNNELIGKFDVLSAKYQFAKEIDGISVDTENNRQISLITAKHPLLDKETVVANNVIIGEEINQLIVSGPNAGGKSVLLKLVGIIVLMNQMVIPVPVAEESKIGFFDHLFIDIGDIQSIQENLSTFSGHITKVINILNKAGSNDLVLIDELGTGTAPNEGEALAVSIAAYLNDKKVKSIITSHFDGVKQYALCTSGVICGSMAFDEGSLTPKYKLYIGIPGNSYGLEIAKKYGMNKSVINNAINYLSDSEHSETNKYLSILMDKINYNEKLIKENEKYKDSLNKKIKENNALQNELDKKNNDFKKDITNIKEKLIEDTLVALEETKREILQKDNPRLHEIISKEKELSDILNASHEAEQEDEIFEVGDFVKDDTFGINGEIISINKNGYKVKTNGGKLYTFSASNLKIVDRPKTSKKRPEINKVDSFIMSTPLKYELNIIGFHIEEARQAVETYIDKAILQNAKQIRIIHGFGSGALRNLVSEILKNNKNVKDSLSGGQFDGGYGVTVVNLK